jgi:hypothetical protein
VHAAIERPSVMSVMPFMSDLDGNRSKVQTRSCFEAKHMNQRS